MDYAAHLSPNMNKSKIFHSTNAEDAESTADAIGVHQGGQVLVRNMDEATEPMEEETVVAKGLSQDVTFSSEVYHETSTNSAAEYAEASFKFDTRDDSARNMETKPKVIDRSISSRDTAAAEFESIAREAALLLDKKLDSNKAWVEKLLDEMTKYTKTLAEVHSEYSRIQGIEHEESQRLDTVEPDVQGATSHLLENSFFGADLGAVADQFRPISDATVGGKRKSDHA